MDHDNLSLVDEQEKLLANIAAAERTFERANRASLELISIFRRTELVRSSSRALQKDIAKWIESIEKRPLLI